jgi:DNA polymerase III epsilon subunit-like protein
MAQPLIFFDTETGGTCPYPHTNSKGTALLCSPIIQLAAIAVDRVTLEPLETFETKINFNLESAEDEALKINHFDPQVWADEAVHPVRAAHNFSNFLNRFKTLPKVSKRGKAYRVAEGAGHNAHRFDGPLLMEWSKALGVFMPLDHIVLDTLSLAKLWTLLYEIPVGDDQALKGYKLGELAEYFNVLPPAEEALHDALVDVKTNIRVYECLRREIRGHCDCLNEVMRQASGQATQENQTAPSLPGAGMQN